MPRSIGTLQAVGDREFLLFFKLVVELLHEISGPSTTVDRRARPRESERMSSPLQSTNLMADDLATADLAEAEELNEAEAEQHIHMPNPSFWPILLSFAIFVTLAGLLVVNSFPWISIIGAPFVFIFMVAWALENPFASRSPLSVRPWWSNRRHLPHRG